jgi:hypothetical protein
MAASGQLASYGALSRTTASGSNLAIQQMSDDDRFLGAIAREQTDRFRLNSVTPDRIHE